MCVCSPVLHKMLLGSFVERNMKNINLHDVNGKAFGKALDMWCGREGGLKLGLEEVKELASVADRFQMTEVVSALDESVKRHLNMSMCGDVLNWSGELGLRESEVASQKLATERFDEFAKTQSFLRLEENVLGILLEGDDLVTRNEEAVWEAVCDWRRAAAGQARGGRRLLEKIRFPLMEEEYLRSRVVGMAPADEAEWMGGVVAEALRAKAARDGGGGFEPALHGPTALDHRVGLGERWASLADGGERRLKGHTAYVSALAECEGRVCTGSWDGSILVWSTTGDAAEGRAAGAGAAAAAPERALEPEGDHDSDGVHSLAAWGGRLVSGHGSGRLRVWDVATGACCQVVEGHAFQVRLILTSV